jgi:uncharacterized protein
MTRTQLVRKAIENRLNLLEDCSILISMKSLHRIPVPGVCSVLLMCTALHLAAADGSRSLALRDAVPRQKFSLSPSADSFSKLWDVIELREKANSGNPFAQHELGLRYLIGKDYSPDTLKAAYWIQKAADQNLLPARYNLGILLNNGWGIPWNPFEAYRHFQYAARHGMKESQYVYGLLLTDNLTVPRNDVEAFRWIRTSADSGFAPAREMLAEYRKRGIGDLVNAQSGRDLGPDGASPDSAAKSPASSGFRGARMGSPGDSAAGPEDEILMKEALLEGRADDEKGGMTAGKTDAADSNRARSMLSIRSAAEAGSPEALTLLGRLIETGDGFEKDDVLASFYYLRAIRNNSPWAPALLSRLIRKDDFLDRLTSRAGRNDPIAEFSWADLVSLGFDRQLNEAQALQFLEASASQKCNSAVVELGLYYFSGKWVTQDREKGKNLLKQAADAGDREARIRLWMIGLGEGYNEVGTALVDSLRRASRDGSILAQAMLGYCYHKGIGVEASLPRSVEYYRKAYQRGSKAAYNALRDIYDGIRPRDPEFQIPD